MVHAAFRGCVDAHGPCDCPWAGLSPEVTLILYNLGVHDDIWGSRYHWRKWWCTCAILLLGAKLVSVMMVSTVHAASEGPADIYIVCAATGDSVEVCGSCCCQKPLGSPWLLIWLWRVRGGPGRTAKWVWLGCILWISQIINKILCRRKWNGI